MFLCFQKLRNKDKSPEVHKPETPVNSKSDLNLEAQLREKTRELQDARKQHRELEKRLDQVEKDFDEAIALLDKKNIDFDNEKLTNLVNCCTSSQPKNSTPPNLFYRTRVVTVYQLFPKPVLYC